MTVELLSGLSGLTVINSISINKTQYFRVRLALSRERELREREQRESKERAKRESKERAKRES